MTDIPQYKSTLTGTEIDQALHNIAQLDAGIAQAKQYAEQAQGYAESINPENFYTKDQADAEFAQKSHATTGTQYGAATDSLYGHVRLSDTTGESDATSGVAATPKCVQDAVESAISGAASAGFVSSGSLTDISLPGVYYVGNSVTNKPISTGGLYILARVNDANGVALFASAQGNDLYIIHKPNSGSPRISKISGSDFSI